MTAAPPLAETKPLPAIHVPARSRVRPADLLLPAAIGLWAIGVSKTVTTAVPPDGLPSLLPVVFYLGLALLVGSAVTELVRDRLSEWRMGLHAAALTVMLYATAPLVYAAGRYSWLYKTIGVVQYVNAHGQLDRSIDIYQNWPGFFALTGWFGQVAGVASPLAYAKWAQFVFELAALPVLYLIYDALALTPRQRWVALLLVPASNWIAQDYFSPQALGTLLSLGIMAIALRWLYVGGQAGDPGPAQAPAAAGAARAWLRWFSSPTARRLSFSLLVTVLFSALTFTHQLSPYMLVLQLGALAAFGLLRPRWLPLVLLAVAVGYFIPRFAWVNSHYGILRSLGDFFSNATPPALTGGAVAPSQRFIEHCAEALSLGIWALAVFGIWRFRRSGKAVLSLTLLAFSPAVMLVLQAYGHEGILRVYLFSLPWSAALAALVIAPAQVPASLQPSLRASKPGSHRAIARADARSGQQTTPSRLTTIWRAAIQRAATVIRRAAAAVGRTATGIVRAATAPLRPVARVVSTTLRPVARVVTTSLRPLHRPHVGDAVRAGIVLSIALTLFFPAFFGDDSFNYMTQTEVDVVASFLQTAPPGRLYLPVDNAPLADTSRYNLFPHTQLFGNFGMFPRAPVPPDIAKKIASNARQISGVTSPAYVVITPSMLAYSLQYLVTSPRSFAILRYSLGRTRMWKELVDQGGVTIYELVPSLPTVG